MLDKKNVWYIIHSSGMFHVSGTGFFESEEEANAKKEEYDASWHPNMREITRTVKSVKAEILPDGRMIVDNRVYPPNHRGSILF